MYEELEEFGLSKTEARVYSTLLILGESKASIITKKCESNRSNVYDALERLIEKGLVSYIFENNVKIFKSNNPKILEDLLNEKKNKLTKILFDLEAKYNNSLADDDATIFRGKKGIKYILDDALNAKEIYSFGAKSMFKEFYPIYYHKWHKKREELKIKLKMIYTTKVKKEKIKEATKLFSMKFLPEKYDYPSTNLIYNDKFTTIVWGEQPFAFVVKSKKAVETNKNFFDLLWSIAKP